MNLENELLSLEKKFWQAIVDKDLYTSVSLATDPCIVTGGQGVAKIDHRTFIKMSEDSPWELHDFAFSDVKVQRVTDDVAVIAYKVREDLTVDGEKMTLEAADASTWVKKDGEWLCVLHTESLIGDPFGRDRTAGNGKHDKGN